MIIYSRLSQTEDTSKPADMLPESLLPLCDSLSQLLHRMVGLKFVFYCYFYDSCVL